MPPRFSYWTIIAGGLPTAFRAAEREELLPTFTRLKQKQPDAEMKWFARGKLWKSPEEAQETRDRHRSGDRGGDRNRDRHSRGEQQGERREARGRDWRPGGDHRDPRQVFKDAKKARNQRIKAEKFERKSERDHAPREERPRRDARTTDRRDAPREERPHRDARATERRPQHQRSQPGHSDRNRKPWTPAGRGGNADRPWHSKPHGQQRDEQRTDRSAPNRQDDGWKGQSRGKDRFPQRREWKDASPGGKPRGDRPTGPAQSRGEWDRHQSAKPHGQQRDQPRAERSTAKRPDGGWKSQSHGKDRFPPRREWRDKPFRDKPQGDKPAFAAPARGERDRHRSAKPHGDKDRPWSAQRPRQDRQRSADDGRSTHRGEGHGDNSWKPRPPRDDAGSDSRKPRQFSPKGFERDRVRGGGTEESTPPPRPRGPNREPKPSEEPSPSAPPRPQEPVTAPPGPPERGRLNRNKRAR